MHAIVHIGAPKAGSSSIQSALRHHVDALAEQGVEAFRMGHTLNNAHTLAMRFMQHRKRLKPQERRKHGSLAKGHEKSQRAWEAFAEQIRARRPEFTVLSSEHFINLRNPEQLVEALRELFDDITLVAYLRDPVEQFRSRIDQEIRGGARFCDLMAPDMYRHYPNARLERYLALVGRERLVVRNFARENLVKGDVVADFLAQVGVIAGRPVSLPEPPSRRNESLCAAATAWLMTANETFRRFTDVDDRETLHQRYELIRRLRLSEELRALPKLRLDDPELIAPIRRNTRDYCLWLNETFLKGQAPLTVEDPKERVLEEAVLRDRMRDWLLGHLTPEALDAVLRAAVSLTRPASSARGRGTKRSTTERQPSAQPQQTHG